MKTRLAAAAAALLISSAIALPAAAVTYSFEFSSAQYNATFTLPSPGTPDDSSDAAPYVYTAFNDVAGTLNGAAYTFDGLIFPGSDYSANGATGGGFSFNYSFGRYFQGEQLFTGSVSAPTFKLGTFALSSFNDGSAGTLTVRDVSASVPEPATWALMILGFGVVGATMRRRQAVIAKVQFS